MKPHLLKQYLLNHFQQQSAFEKLLLIGTLLIILAPILFVLWFIASGFLYKSVALSDERLLKTKWKYYDGNCETDGYQLTKQQVQQRDKALILQYRWYDKIVVMTLKDGSNCSYISKGYYVEDWYREK